MRDRPDSALAALDFAAEYSRLDLRREQQEVEQLAQSRAADAETPRRFGVVCERAGVHHLLDMVREREAPRE